MGRAREIIGDKQVRRFLEGLPHALTYSERHAACAERFGADRAPSAELIKAHHLTKFPRSTGAAHSHLYSNPEVRQYVDDRIGLMSLSDLAEACRRKFGALAPSRTALGRYLQQARRKARA